MPSKIISPSFRPFLKKAGFWLLAFRPKTLTQPIVPVIISSSLSYAEGFPVNWPIIFFALLTGVLLTIGTNLINDASDFSKGADTEARLGPKRAVQNGWLTEKEVFNGGLIALGLALLFGIPLIIKGGLAILLLLLASLICAYIYTAGPFPLAYLGLGEFFVILFYGMASVCGLFYLLTGFVNLDAAAAGLQIGCLSSVLISLNNLRDMESDRKAGKKTLAARFGITFARMEITSLIFAPLCIGLMSSSTLASAILPLLTLPIGIKIIKNTWKNNPSSRFNLFFEDCGKLHFLFGILLSLGYLIK